MKRIIGLVIIFYILFLPNYTYAMIDDAWVWVYSSDSVSYYLDKYSACVNDRGCYFYEIREVISDDVLRHAIGENYAKKDPNHDYSDIKTIHTYFASITTHDDMNNYYFWLCERNVSFIDSSGRFIAGYRNPNKWYRIKEGSDRQYVDIVARSWAVYKPDFHPSDIYS